MGPAVIQSTDSLTFADYFKLNAEVDEVLAYFGVSFEARHCDLPRTQRVLDGVPDLVRRIEKSLPYISLTNETARREFLIAPVMLELLNYTKGRLRVEYPIQVNDQLKGNLDYFIHVQHSLVVIEAKNADLIRGFTQLAVELVALDRWVGNDEPRLHGAVSIGDVWQFAVLERQEKQVLRDLTLHRVPEDVETILRILVGILIG